MKQLPTKLDIVYITLTFITALLATTFLLMDANADTINHPTFVTPTKNTYQVAIIDTGFDMRAGQDIPVKLCKEGHYDFPTKKRGITTTDIHGTLVVSALVENLAKVDYCVIILTVWSSRSKGHTQTEIDFDTYLDSIKRLHKYIKTLKLTAINMSASGSGHIFVEKMLYQDLSKQGVQLFFSAGNDGQSLNKACTVFPACYNLPNSHIVGAKEENSFMPEKYSNYGKVVTVWASGNVSAAGYSARGTSFASPRALADYLLALQYMRQK